MITTNYKLCASLAIGLAAACAGTAARNNAMLPAMRQAWNSISAQVAREVSLEPDAAASAALVAANAAMASGDATAFAAVEWTKIDTLAERDVARRLAAELIGPQVAESLRGRLAEFIESRASYLGGSQ